MSGPELDLVKKMLAALELAVDPARQEQLAHYVRMLLDGLKKHRLTGEKRGEEIINKQILDSLYLLKTTALPPQSRVLDLGSGGGLPGIPLKLCRPAITIYLLDSNRRKMNFLKGVVDALGLNDTHLLCGRAEDFGRDSSCREQFDVVVSKAVAEAAVLAELALPLLKLGGKALFYKGPRGAQEMREAAKAIEVCGGHMDRTWQYELPGGEKRVLYGITKNRATPAKYPRRAGVPGRKPLR